jgi:hypothetical protein
MTATLLYTILVACSASNFALTRRALLLLINIFISIVKAIKIRPVVLVLATILNL